MSGQRRRLPLVVGWLPTFLAFPIGGLIAIETVGARDAALPGLAGGLIVGLVLGVAQWLVLRGHGVGLRWVPITVVAFAGGAAVATVVTDGGTKLADVVVAAVIIGAVVGAIQSLVLTAEVRYRVLWTVATMAGWGLGWLVTWEVIVDNERGHHAFGASGALLATLLASLALYRILGETSTGQTAPPKPV